MQNIPATLYLPDLAVSVHETSTDKAQITYTTHTFPAKISDLNQTFKSL